MNDKFQLPFGNLDWFEVQKQFMDALAHGSSYANAFTGSGSRVSNTNWPDAMNLWWQVFKPGATVKNENVFGKMLEQCQAYYILSEQFAKLLETMKSSKESKDDYMNFLNKQFQELEDALANNHPLFSRNNFIDQCEMQTELLKNIFSGSSLFTNEIINGFSPELKKLRERLLPVTGPGYNCETQEKWQEAVRLWGIYQDNCREFHGVMLRVHHTAMELMRKRLLKMYKQGEDIESVRQIYHIWVESSEKAYLDFAFTEEFAELNGRLVNSLMAFKNKSHEITEDYLDAMNLPTSSAIDALARRQYELRKQVRAMEAELKAVRTELDTQKQRQHAKTKDLTGKEKPAAKGRQVNAAAKKEKTSRRGKLKQNEEKKPPKAVGLNRAQSKNKKVSAAQSKRDSDARNSADDKSMVEIKF